MRTILLTRVTITTLVAMCKKRTSFNFRSHGFRWHRKITSIILIQSRAKFAPLPSGRWSRLCDTSHGCCRRWNLWLSNLVWSMLFCIIWRRSLILLIMRMEYQVEWMQSRSWLTWRALKRWDSSTLVLLFLLTLILTLFIILLLIEQNHDGVSSRTIGCSY